MRTEPAKAVIMGSLIDRDGVCDSEATRIRNPGQFRAPPTSTDQSWIDSPIPQLSN